MFNVCRWLNIKNKPFAFGEDKECKSKMTTTVNQAKRFHVHSKLSLPKIYLRLIDVKPGSCIYIPCARLKHQLFMVRIRMSGILIISELQQWLLVQTTSQLFRVRRLLWFIWEIASMIQQNTTTWFISSCSFQMKKSIALTSSGLKWAVLSSQQKTRSIFDCLY